TNLLPSSRTLTKSGAGGLSVNKVRAAALYINGGSVAVLAGRGSSGTSRVGSLTIASGAAMNLADQDLILDYSGGSPRSAIKSALQAGYNAGSWNGTGINSSATAVGNAGRKTALGYAEASDVLTYSNGTASFSGQTL